MRKAVDTYTEAKAFINQAHEAGRMVYQDLEFVGAVLTTEIQSELDLYENGGCMKEVRTAAHVRF